MHVITDGAAIETFDAVRPSTTEIVRFAVHPDVGCVAVMEYVPGTPTTGLAMVGDVILPGPVHKIVEVAGVKTLVNADVAVVQVIGLGTTGKSIIGTVISCGTVAVLKSVHPVTGLVIVNV